MKTTLYAVLFAVSAIAASQADAQFRQRTSDEPSAAESFVHPPTTDAWLGFFNPENFSMHQSYSMSYSAFASQGVALGRYTNTMDYKFSDKLDARVAVSLQHSPYSTLDKGMMNSLTGIFLDRAEINYKPTDNMFLRISYRQVPAYYGYYSPFMMGYQGYDNEGF
jgi:hypothetical protein